MPFTSSFYCWSMTDSCINLLYNASPFIIVVLICSWLDLSLAVSYGGSQLMLELTASNSDDFTCNEDVDVEEAKTYDHILYDKATGFL